MLVPAFPSATNHMPATQVGEVVGKGAQRRHHVVDVGDVLLPLHLLAFADSEILEVDAAAHRVDCISRPEIPFTPATGA